MRLRLLLILSVFLAACSSEPADGEYSIEIYANGDIHGCFFDTNYIDSTYKEASLSAISSYLTERRQAGSNLVALDLGDHNHGDNSTHYYNYVYDYPPDEPHFYTRIASFMDYDAIVAGNHDIEAGKGIFTRIMDELDIPLLGANVVDSAACRPYFEPYTIIERSGIRIAIIGLTTSEVELWLGNEKIKGLDVLPVLQSAEYWVSRVRERENPHLLFLAIHAGTGDGTMNDTDAPCRFIARSLKGIDGVFASHDHIPYCGKEWNGEDSIFVVNSGPYGKKLSGVKILLSFSNGELSGKSMEPFLIDMTGRRSDSLFNATFRDDFLRVRDFSASKIGSIDADIRPGEIFDAPCLYSNLLHYVQLKETGADISFVSPSKFRGYIPAGDICYNDILNIYPFENLLYKVSLTGAQIKTYLELSYDNWKNKPVAFDCAGGLRYTVDFTKPLGSRVEILSFTDGREFNVNETYLAAMASYRANGGGDILLQATGLHPKQLEGIFIAKYGPVKEMLYRFFLNEKKTAASLATVSEWKIIR